MKQISKTCKGYSVIQSSSLSLLGFVESTLCIAVPPGIAPRQLIVPWNRVTILECGIFHKDAQVFSDASEHMDSSPKKSHKELQNQISQQAALDYDSTRAGLSIIDNPTHPRLVPNNNNVERLSGKVQADGSLEDHKSLTGPLQEVQPTVADPDSHDEVPDYDSHQILDATMCIPSEKLVAPRVDGNSNPLNSLTTESMTFPVNVDQDPGLPTGSGVKAGLNPDVKEQDSIVKPILSLDEGTTAISTETSSCKGKRNPTEKKKLECRSIAPAIQTKIYERLRAVQLLYL